MREELRPLSAPSPRIDSPSFFPLMIAMQQP
jgi:hypothetical protein